MLQAVAGRVQFLTRLAKSFHQMDASPRTFPTSSLHDLAAFVVNISILIENVVESDTIVCVAEIGRVLSLVLLCCMISQAAAFSAISLRLPVMYRGAFLGITADTCHRQSSAFAAPALAGRSAAGRARRTGWVLKVAGRAPEAENLLLDILSNTKGRGQKASEQQLAVSLIRFRAGMQSGLNMTTRCRCLKY